jgi:hypothetical protein
MDGTVEKHVLDRYDVIFEIDISPMQYYRYIRMYFIDNTHEPMTYGYMSERDSSHIDAEVKNIVEFGNSGGWEKLRHIETKERLLRALNDYIEITSRINDICEDMKKATECDRRLNEHLDDTLSRLDAAEERNKELEIRNKILESRNAELSGRLSRILGTLSREINAHEMVPLEEVDEHFAAENRRRMPPNKNIRKPQDSRKGRQNNRRSWRRRDYRGDRSDKY